MNKKLLTKIEKFLEVRRKSEGGDWSLVESEDMTQLDDIIYHLVKAKWEGDYKDSLPVGWAILNKHTHYWPCPIWQINKHETADDLHLMSLMVHSISERIGRVVQDKLSFERDNKEYYILLTKGQIIAKGDEWYDKDYDGWNPVIDSIGSKYGGEIPVRRVRDDIKLDFSKRERERWILE